MSDCCSTATEPSSCSTSPKKRPCPICGSECVEVGLGTVMHHLKAAWNYALETHKYYFCESPDCDVVYFDEVNGVIGPDQIRGEIGQKRTDPNRLLCYCFGVTQRDAESDPTAKVFVIEQTKAGNCACDSRNPSGRCCLKDFPK